MPRSPQDLISMLARFRQDLTAPRSPSLPVVVLSVAAIAVGTLAIGLLEQAADIPDASAVYLVAVVIVGSVAGTAAAVGTAIAAFIVYDLLFTAPRFSLAVSDTSELLNLVLVLIVALAVGRLAALGRQRAGDADRRAAEATGLFAVSRLLATADGTDSVAGPIVDRLARDAALDRVWIGLEGGPRERILADTGGGQTPATVIVSTLVRTPGDEPARWVRAHDGTQRAAIGPRPAPDGGVLRVRIETGGSVFGSLWALKPPGTGLPSPESTRLLSLAADQIALGLRRDRLRAEATSAEVARRSDALKSALLDSVSHDLRTPLASIRATAGNLADPAIPWTSDDVRHAAESIDEEARRLDRFVRSVLDLSRIDAGALRADLEVFDLPELIERSVARLRPVLGDRPVAFEIGTGLPLVRVDAVLFDTIVANVLENVAVHTPPGTPLTIRATRISDAETGYVRLTFEDAGPGVSAPDLARIFDKFQRSDAPGERARRGMGIGLSIVRGMAEAFGGRASARASEPSGLSVDIDLPAAPEPPTDADDA
jgi:two-component system sensor histidine kinase KdpD